ncbi:hypothetical protein GLYMA_08G348250v4 [Glycine max]|nr:hypothetical protein GLYMA_08G348250v4 [Glycine max]KAH1054546.1 hypothetical protein GYH30_023369 [Glycine max]
MMITHLALFLFTFNFIDLYNNQHPYVVGLW